MEINPVCDGPVLLVGEGDFSFSCSLLNHLPNERIISTSFLSCEDITLHKQASDNIQYLKQHGVCVLNGVDATHLEDHEVLNEQKFSKIIFNFPHVGGKSNLKKNRQLLKQFFISADKVLHGEGEIFVSLCKGQGGTSVDHPRAWSDTWQVVAMAACANFILHKVFPFSAEKYQLYTSTGYRSQDKHFNTDGALTHLFLKSSPVLIRTQLDYPILSLSEEHTCNYTGPYKETPTYSFIKNIKISDWKKQQWTCMCDNCKETVTLTVPCHIHDKLRQNLLEEEGYPINKVKLDIIENFTEKRYKLQQIPSVVLYRGTFKTHHHRLQCLERFQEYFGNCDDCVVVQSATLLGNTGIEEMNSCEVSYEVSLVMNCDNLQIASSLAKEILLKISIKSGQMLHEEIDGSLLVSNIYDTCSNRLLVSCAHNKSIVEICFYLNPIASLKYNLPNVRLLWSLENRVRSELRNAVIQNRIYEHCSIDPPVWQHDMSFWCDSNMDFDYLQFCDIIRDIAGDSVIDVRVIDTYLESEKALTSYCYRIVYQSFDRALSYIASHEMQNNIRLKVADLLKVKLR